MGWSRKNATPNRTPVRTEDHIFAAQSLAPAPGLWSRAAPKEEAARAMSRTAIRRGQASSRPRNQASWATSSGRPPGGGRLGQRATTARPREIGRSCR
jgi:hypothetical protein